MKFDLKQILERPGDADVVTADVDLTDAGYNGLKPFHAPVRLTASARNRAGVVSLDCAYRYTLEMPCDRCGIPVKREMTLDIPHTVVRELQGEDTDDDYLVAQDGIVELDELAANDILSELPAKFLCKEDCRGICPGCGRDLNHEECVCGGKPADPRWDALNDLKL